MKMKLDRMGVLVLMSHLIITLAILTLYGIFTWLGKDLGTIETILLMIVGYWFGAMGPDKLRPNGTTQINQANEVKIEAEKKEEIK